MRWLPHSTSSLYHRGEVQVLLQEVAEFLLTLLPGFVALLWDARETQVVSASLVVLIV